MRAFLVSDNHDTLVALRMAGIKGVVAHGSQETGSAVREALIAGDIGILVLTEKAAAVIPDLVREIRESGTLPLLVEVPDRHGSERGKDFLTSYVRNAIGVKIE